MNDLDTLVEPRDELVREIEYHQKMDYKIFSDPFESIFSSSKYHKQIENYHIREQKCVDEKLD
jgi:hypothetical protein